MSGHRLELFVRSLVPTGANRQFRRVLDRLETLVERGAVEEYTVTVWGEEISTDEVAARTDAGRHVRDSLAAFEEWARENDADIDRFYETRTVERELTGESYRVTSLPVMALAEYDGDGLSHVTPHESGDEVRTVRDRIETLADRAVGHADESRMAVAGAGDDD